MNIPRPRPATIGQPPARPPEPEPRDHRSPRIKPRAFPAPRGCTCGGHVGVHSTVGCLTPDCPCPLGIVRDLYNREGPR